MLAQVDRFAIWLTTYRPAWWLWPAALVCLALVADGAALLLQPLGAEWVAWPTGGQFGDQCAMITQAGVPCPQCGMTRSFVYAVRGDLLASWFYNPAGLGLWLWLNAGGLVGASRLLVRDPRRLEPPTWLLVGWTLIWLVPIYGGGYALRLAGINPLP
jgi:hypothetical protein